MSINLENIATEDLIKELESRGYKATKKKTATINTESKELLNPVIEYRENGEEKLREKLEQIELKELVRIIRKWIPDISGSIYRCKKQDKVIDYIVDRANKQSKIGQCFRTCTEDTRIS